MLVFNNVGTFHKNQIWEQLGGNLSLEMEDVELCKSTRRGEQDPTRNWRSPQYIWCLNRACISVTPIIIWNNCREIWYLMLWQKNVSLLLWHGILIGLCVRHLTLSCKSVFSSMQKAAHTQPAFPLVFFKNNSHCFTCYGLLSYRWASIVAMFFLWIWCRERRNKWTVLCLFGAVDIEVPGTNSCFVHSSYWLVKNRSLNCWVRNKNQISPKCPN